MSGVVGAALRGRPGVRLITDRRVYHTGHWPLPTAHCILLFFRGIVFNNYKNYNYKEKSYELAESP